MPCLFFNDATKGVPGPSKSLLSFAIQNENRDALIEQSYILIKQSVGQVLPYQRTEFGYAFALSESCDIALNSSDN